MLMFLSYAPGWILQPVPDKCGGVKQTNQSGRRCVTLVCSVVYSVFLAFPSAPTDKIKGAGRARAQEALSGENVSN